MKLLHIYVYIFLSVEVCLCTRKVWKNTHNIIKVIITECCNHGLLFFSFFVRNAF